MIKFPIDLVYTWVDGSDEELIQIRQQYEAEAKNVAEDSKASCRWRDLDELKYSIESANRFAPWLRTIFIVSDHQRPYWFDEKNPGKLVFVDHPELYGEFEEHLPTFNSHSIESHLHRIPGLSEHFIYANDDTFFGSPVIAEDFFTPDGKFKVFLSTYEMPTGTPDSETPPYTAAQMNITNLISACFGQQPDLKRLKHQMKALTKTSFKYCWKHETLMLYLFNTSSTRFRDFTDVDTTSLVSHVGLLTQQAVSAQIQSKYYVLQDDSDLNKVFLHLFKWRPNPKVYCINDAMQKPSTKHLKRIHVGFEKYLPHKYIR
jgi:hypothetical protein